jgi:hypothetical protein
MDRRAVLNFMEQRKPLVETVDGEKSFALATQYYS